MQTVLPLLKGMPVLVMRRGLFPNRQDILDVMASYPGHVVQTETMHQPCRFVLTVRKNHHVR